MTKYKIDLLGKLDKSFFTKEEERLLRDYLKGLETRGYTIKKDNIEFIKFVASNIAECVSADKVELQLNYDVCSAEIKIIGNEINFVDFRTLSEALRLSNGEIEIAVTPAGNVQITIVYMLQKEKIKRG